MFQPKTVGNRVGPEVAVECGGSVLHSNVIYNVLSRLSGVDQRCRWGRGVPRSQTTWSHYTAVQRPHWPGNVCTYTVFHGRKQRNHVHIFVEKNQ